MKKMMSVLAIFALVLALASPWSTAAGVEFPKIELKFSTSTSPQENPAKGLAMMKEYIESKTGGNVKFEPYLQSSLFTQEQEVPAIIRGNLEMCFSEAPWLVDYMPELAMYGSGYLFASLDHWKKFYASDLAREMFESVAQSIGVRPLGTVYLGKRLINLNVDKQILSRDDMKNIKLRMPSTDAWLFLGQALGANPIPVPYADLYLALQTGTVDGQDNPLPAIMNRSFYEVTKSVTMTNHVFGTNWIMIGEKQWQKFSPELRRIIQEAVDMATAWINDANERQENELITELGKKGMSIYQPTPEELARYRQEVLDYYYAHKEVVGGWDMDMHARIQDLNK